MYNLKFGDKVKLSPAYYQESTIKFFGLGKVVAVHKDWVTVESNRYPDGLTLPPDRFKLAKRDVVNK